MFVNPGRNPSILIRRFGRETVKDDPKAIGVLDKLGHNLSLIGHLVYVDLDGSLHRGQSFPCVVKMIPWCSISHATNVCGAIAFEAELSTVKRMFWGLENAGAFRILGGSELPFFCVG